jgi:hypothetical protein
MVMDKPVFRSQKYPSSIEHLKPVRISFDNKHDKQTGFYILMTSGAPVTNFGNGQYLVNTAQLEILKNNHIHYNIDK